MLVELRGVVNHLHVEKIRQQLGDDAMRGWSDEQICTAVVYGRIEPAVKLESRQPPAWQFIKGKAAEQQHEAPLSPWRRRVLHDQCARDGTYLPPSWDLGNLIPQATNNEMGNGGGDA